MVSFKLLPHYLPAVKWKEPPAPIASGARIVKTCCDALGKGKSLALGRN
jgi:hypothetical protein